MKSTFLLISLLCWMQVLAAQSLPAETQPSYRVEAQIGASLLGRASVKGGFISSYGILRNEIWRIGAAGWRSMGSHFQVGASLGYAQHRLAFWYSTMEYGGGWSSGDADVRLHALTLAPAIRWQRKADRGIFVQLALDMHLALGESGWHREAGVVQKEALPAQGIDQVVFQFGPELSLGYLLPLGRGDALSMRLMAGWYKRDFLGDNGTFYFPPIPWELRPGLCLGWNFEL